MGKVKAYLLEDEDRNALLRSNPTQEDVVFEKYYSRFDINDVFNDLVDRQENMHRDGTYCVTVTRKEF